MIVSLLPEARSDGSFDDKPSTKSAAGSSPALWAFEALQHIPDNVFAQDIDGRILVANGTLARSCGYACPYDIIGRSVSDVFPAETIAAFRRMDGQVAETGKPVLEQEQDICHADGQRRWLKASRIPLHDDHRNLIGIVCTFRDITEVKEAERLMLAQANLLDMVAQSAPLAEICERIVAVVEDHLPGMAGAIQLLSPDKARLLPPAAPTMHDALRERLTDATNPLARTAMDAIAAGQTIIVPDIQDDPTFADELDALSAGNVKAVWAVPICSLAGVALGTLSLLSRVAATPSTTQSDLITMASHMVSAAIERQEDAERNKFLASHDSLTLLPNRLVFEERLTAAVDAAKANHSSIGVAFFDLDHFKSVNDSLGHSAGDNLLKIVADRARSSLRQGDVIARLGGDEFVILLDRLPLQSEFVEHRFCQIHEAVSAPTIINGRAIAVTCSMGIAFFPNHADNAAALVANADVAMYRAKQIGRDNIQIFRPDMRKVADQRSLRLCALEAAITRGEFVLHYQPQVDIDTGLIFGAESLVRWNHPQHGLLPPGEFISMAEESGLIVPLGDWVLNAACRQNKLWQDQGLPKIVVSVNVSARQFHGPKLFAQVATALETSGLDPAYLELELTESLVMQEGAAAKIRELEALGVKLAIDDFGTGYSSLSALKRFPVNRLKIDRSFVRDISQDENDRAIISAIISMAKKLRMKVLVEGVETDDQLALVHELGCKEVQGFYFSKPIPPGNFKDLLADVQGWTMKPLAWHVHGECVSAEAIV